MKRVSLILALAVVLALTVAATAFAAQDKVTDWRTNPTTDNDYQSTAADADYIPPGNIALDPVNNTGRIHGGYEKNTDACAACHSTHTGVGEALLQWSDVNTACFACHDGTVAGTYNVEAGTVGSTDTRTSGGLFGTGSEVSLSTHGVSTTVETNSAPGGADMITPGQDANGVWTTEFTCASCHTPHGLGGNARILNPDPNGAAESKAPGFNGNATVAASIYAQDATTMTINFGTSNHWINAREYAPKYYITSTLTDKTTGAVIDAAASIDWADKFTTNYELGRATVTFGSYTKDYKLKDYPTAGTTTTVNASATISNTTPIQGAFVPAIRVLMTISNKLQATETVTYDSGLNAFCAACHTDYDTTSVSSPHANLNGTYAKAYRHKVGRSYRDVPGLKFEGTAKNITCLTCHVAHGTSQDYWVDTLAGVDKKADGSAYWTTTTAVELDGSSALKRKPNMSACESCHKKGAGSTWESQKNADTQF